MTQVLQVLSALVLALALSSGPAMAGCDPCKCGLGNGVPPPPECANRPHGLGSELKLDDAVNPCVGTTGWRAALCDFSKTKLVHDAWGYEHSLRDYTLAIALAKQEGTQVDEEVVFAAALLHDMGGFAPYQQAGVDHAVRSTQVADTVLGPAGFPVAKSDAVKAAILHHSYYDPTRPASAAGLVLHDADGLDFLGGVAAMRILAIAGRDKATPNVATSLKLLRSLQTNVPPAIYGGSYSHGLAQQRTLELGHVLDAIEQETFGFGVPGQ